MSEPEVVVLANEERAADEAAERIAAALVDAVEAARAGRLGDDRRFSAGRHATAAWPRSPCVGTIPWASVHVWWGDDRYVPRDHPLSNVKPFDDVLLDIADAEEGTAGGRQRGVPIPIENIHPFPTGEAIGRARRGGLVCRGPRRRVEGSGPPEQDGWPVFDLIVLGMGADGHILSGLPRLRGIRLDRARTGDPGPDPHRAARRAGHAEPGGRRRRAPGPRRRPRARRRRRSSARSSARNGIRGRWPAQLARREGAIWIIDEDCASELPGR